MATQIKCIDVSTFQKTIDWAAVKRSGVGAAVIKATQGRAESSASYLFTDYYFSANMAGAAKAGIEHIGVYHYFTAKNDAEAKKEAAYYISLIKPYAKQINIFAAVDVESVHLSGMSRAALTSAVRTFYNAVEAAGLPCAVYTNPNFLQNRFSIGADMRLWLALWRSAGNVPTGYKNMCMWQWGGSAVAGIVGNVDTNIFYPDVLGAAKVDKWESIQRRCGLDDNTMRYLHAYKYADALADKLYKQMV